MQFDPFADFDRLASAVWNRGRNPVGPYVPTDAYRRSDHNVVAPFGCPPGLDLCHWGWLLGER